MTEFQINDHILDTECETLAREIVDEFTAYELADGENLSDYRSDLSDAVHETVDGHEWTIYPHKSLMLCAHCNTDEGEAFLADVGLPGDVTIHSIASMIAYGEMRARVEQAIDDILAEQD